MSQQAEGPRLAAMGQSSPLCLLGFETFSHSPTVFHKKETLQQKKRRPLYKFAEAVFLKTKQPGISSSTVLKQDQYLIPSL